MTFAEKMTHLRKINGYTQNEFAELCGVSRQTVYKWENAKALPDIKKAAIILRLYGVTLNQMINDDIDIDDDGYAVRKHAEQTAEKTKDEIKNRGFFSKMFGKKP